jgi:hypothetical protein
MRIINRIVIIVYIQIKIIFVANKEDIEEAKEEIRAPRGLEPGCSINDSHQSAVASYSKDLSSVVEVFDKKKKRQELLRTGIYIYIYIYSKNRCFFAFVQSS